MNWEREQEIRSKNWEHIVEVLKMKSESEFYEYANQFNWDKDTYEVIWKAFLLRGLQLFAH